MGDVSVAIQYFVALFEENRIVYFFGRLGKKERYIEKWCFDDVVHEGFVDLIKFKVELALFN